MSREHGISSLLDRDLKIAQKHLATTGEDRSVITNIRLREKLKAFSAYVDTTHSHTTPPARESITLPSGTNSSPSEKKDFSDDVVLRIQAIVFDHLTGQVGAYRSAYQTTHYLKDAQHNDHINPINKTIRTFIKKQFQRLHVHLKGHIF